MQIHLLVLSTKQHGVLSDQLVNHKVRMPSYVTYNCASLQVVGPPCHVHI